MSLRARLTLLYTTLVGGILLIFGMAVYASASFTLLAKIDETLERTSVEIISKTLIDPTGKPTIFKWRVNDLPADVYVQLWGQNQTILFKSQNSISDQPLDTGSLDAIAPAFRDVEGQRGHLRVFTVPLIVKSGRPIGTLQIGESVDTVDAVQQTLSTVLVLSALILTGMAGLAVFLSTNRALAPLEEATQAALQITRADDLSRRIPYQGPPGDEVGTLIRAFNQTLSRLEGVFNTQRRFMADVGHELRTPLTVIKGNVGLMQRMGQADEESLSNIINEVDRLTRLVGDLLLLAQAESGKMPLDHRMVELDTLLLEALHEMSVLARDRIQLRVGDIDQVLVCGDRDRLKQVLLNLIGNAIKYTPHGGEVVVAVGKSGNQARLTVSDNGPGIPTEDLPHIFERFYRAEKSRTRSKDGKGFGLGLSIAYWIARNHGGRIEVDSTEGQGTTFCVWLPLAADNCGAVE